MERVLVEQALQALANGQPSLVVLALDALGPAHLLGELRPPADLLELRFPRHGSSLVQDGLLMTRVRSDMVANVWKVSVAVGQSVEAGDTIVILESMKTEIPIEAPVAGSRARAATSSRAVPCAKAT